MSLLIFLKKKSTTSQETVSPLTIKVENYVSVSSLVDEQLPDFIRVDHPRLVDFMEAYYEWQEQKNEVIYSTYALKDFADVDDTLTKFIKHFKSQYLDLFPEELAYDSTTGDKVDQIRLIKRIKEFYRAKGTEKSYRLLMRLLNDSVVHNFYYPNIDIIKSSTGKWITNKTIKTSSANTWRLADDAQPTIIQKTQTGKVLATATVKSIRKYQTQSVDVSECVIDDINGNFDTTQLITFSAGGDTGAFTESPYGVIQSIGIESGATAGKPIRGIGYKIGERIFVNTGTGGSEAFAEISDINGLGGIVAIDVVNSGISYKETDNITFDIQTNTGTGAGLTSSIGPITTYPGYYFGTLGQPSSNKKMFDNWFYQDFSYEMKTDIALKKYKKQLLELVHPAGTLLFNQMLLRMSYDISISYKNKARPQEISILGHYTPYDWNTTENLRYNSTGTDLYPFGYNGGATVDANGGATIAHPSSVVRSSIYYGLVYNDYMGRTGYSDLGGTAGSTYAYDLGAGSTWDPGVTGPMYNLSNGVFLTASTGGSGASAAEGYIISGTAAAGDFANYGSYWVVYPHPNSRSIDTISSGCSFSAVPLQPFFYIDKNENDGISTDFTRFSP
jgi:hypothetical protein